MLETLRKWFVSLFIADRSFTEGALRIGNENLRKDLEFANAELREWRSRPEAEMLRKASESEIAAIHAKTLASEALLRERKLYSTIIRKLVRLCITADVVMRRKRAKKGVTIEAANEWLADFENVKKEHLQDISKLDD